jgi:hypothetical protein
MAENYTPHLGLAYPDFGDADWNTDVEDNWALLDASPLGALAVTAAETPSASLNVAVAAGSFRKSDGTIVAYAGTASQAMTTATTNYVYLTDAGVLTVSTSSYPAAAFHVRLATVVAGATTITSIADDRIFAVAMGANGSTIYLPLAGGTMADGSGVVTIGLGATNGTKVGATGDKVGFLGATPIVRPANTVEIVAGLVNLGLRTTGGNPDLALGTGAIGCGTITLADAQNIVVNATTGTKIGTGTTQKLAFWNATPVAQQANSVDLVTLLSTLGLRASGGNPPLNIGSGAITCGALNVGSTVTITDAVNVAVGTSTGTKIGTATSQKLGFWNATPIVQPASANQAAVGALATTGLTDSTGGTADGTLAAVGATNAGDVSADINNNFKELQVKLGNTVTDLTTLKTLVNQIRSDLVAAGLMKGSA